jgi:HEAT repeat protein
MEDFTELVKTLKAYDWGKSGAPLLAVDAEIRKIAGMPDRMTKLEGALLEVLQSDAASGAKRGVCKSLSLIATERSAPVLEKMLVTAETTDMARYVLERMAPGAADSALRGAISKTNGRTLTGIVNSIGNRKDAMAAPALSRLLNGSDEAVAEAAACALGKIGGGEAIRALAGQRNSPRARVRAESADAYLVCAGRLAAEGKQSEADAMYRELSAEGMPQATRLAAQRALKGR